MKSLLLDRPSRSVLSLGCLAFVAFGFIQNGPSGIQPGEHGAVNNIFETGSYRYELEGVCKLSEDNAVCWNPDGSQNKGLTDKLTEAIRHPIASNQTSYSVTFQKKARFVFVKKTQIKPSGSGPDNGRVFQQRTYSGSFVEGWSENGSSLSASERGFNGGEISLSGIQGAFEPGTKEYPLRYEFTSSPIRGTTRKLEPGKFEVDGNTFEIVSISDHVKPTNYVSGGPVSTGDYRYVQRLPKTDILVKVVSITNPFSAMAFQLADDKGNAIQYVDEKENTVTSDEASKWYSLNQQNSANGKQKPFPYFGPGSYYLDPKNANSPYPQPTSFFYISKGKCKNIVITTTQREVYVFEHIKLDPS